MSSPSLASAKKTKRRTQLQRVFGPERPPPPEKQHHQEGKAAETPAQAQPSDSTAIAPNLTVTLAEDDYDNNYSSNNNVDDEEDETDGAVSMLAPLTTTASQHRFDDTDTYYYYDTSSLEFRRRKQQQQHAVSSTLRRVQRVSRHAALTTKQQFWDSNKVSIDAALSAVDQWEAAYRALRAILVASVHSARGVYGAAKEGVGKIEHGLLAPVRDWILLPAFSGMERAVTETAWFLQSTQAQHLAEQTLEWTKQVPLVGENVLAPSLLFSVGLVKRTWEIVQYPIPSRHQVRESVDWTLTTTKWALSTAGREIYLYIKRADANLTRTLSHTQWKVLGSGPYETLDPLNRLEVIDHLCERYFSLVNAVARYELAAHIRAHNRPLYHDLVVTGLLRERGATLTVDDEWLSATPSYYPASLDPPYLLSIGTTKSAATPAQAATTTAAAAYEPSHISSTNMSPLSADDAAVSALWFRLPNVNGKRPSRDAPWLCFTRQEQKALETRYIHLVETRQGALLPLSPPPDNQADNGANRSNQQAARMMEPTSTNISDSDGDRAHKYPTIAKWYEADLTNDILVDQKRQAVSFYLCCPRCRAPHTAAVPPLVPKQFGDLCDDCLQDPLQKLPDVKADWAITLSGGPGRLTTSPPPLCMIMRPTMWRFHGPGDQVRRATWFLEAGRNGLQPFDEEASAILEDAYLFLKWMSIRHAFEEDSDLDGTLLTVEVPCPDGTDRLVQFSSLTRATAIQKGIGAAVALFKRQVYRGAWLKLPGDQDHDASGKNQGCVHQAEKPEHLITDTERILRALESNGSLGDTSVPNTSIRSVLTTPGPEETRMVLFTKNDNVNASLAVPPVVLEETMAKQLEDAKDGRISHLVLIVHGIGEMLRTIDVFGLALPNLSSIVDCCAFLRKNHAEVQDAHFQEMYPSADAASRASTGRVEYLPVEWHEAFSILSRRRASFPDSSEPSSNRHSRTVMINDISLRTIPNMREFANDTLMDVLYFMSPEHHDIIIDVVTNEMNVVAEKFRKLHSSDFKGRISVVGHSLGSIIAWDILCNQYPDGAPVEEPQLQQGFPSAASLDTVSGYYSPATERSERNAYAPEWASAPPQLPSSPRSISTYPKLEFVVDNFFLLGSPVAVFLMIRNQRKPLCEDFSLRGCKRVFNIFHPYDPVAYRLEPCIDPRNADFEPTIMKHWNGGFRVQYHTKRLWRKLVESTWKTQQNVVEAFEASMAGMGLIDSTNATEEDEDDSASEVSSEDPRANRVVTGQLNQGRRIDYMLQEKEIENANEYVAALAAHSSYWIEKDLSLFIARQIYLSTIEFAHEDRDSWEPIESSRSNVMN